MPRIGFDEVAELSGCLLPRIGLLDAFNTGPGMFDRTSFVRFSKIQMKSTGRDKASHLRRIAIL